MAAQTMGSRCFLTAEWRHLAMLSYAVDPALLRPRVPGGTELDAWGGDTYLSLVGFLFRDVRIRGVAVPFHRSFEEVNLRFYVRRRCDDGWRRGVVFVRELVPRRAVACVARWLYGERYASVPMRHSIDLDERERRVSGSVEYAWRLGGREHALSLEVAGDRCAVAPGSHEEFITEHSWGYTATRNGATTEYRVDHPSWSVVGASSARFDGDGGAVYGIEFARVLEAPPVSAFLAAGSAVSVSRGVRITPRGSR